MLQRTLTIIFSIAVVLRLTNLALLGDTASNLLIEDSALYWNGAQYWLESGSFSKSGAYGYAPETERAPLYFLFLIPFRWLFGDTVIPALIAQALIDSGTCVVIALLGTFINRTTGFVAGLIAACWINLIIHSGMILTDSLFVFLVCLVLLYAANFAARGRYIDIVLAGILCGLAIMTRPVALFLPIAMAIATPFIVRNRGANWTNGIVAALILVILSALPAVPLLYRNYTQFGVLQLTHQNGTHLLSWVVGISESLASGRSFDAVSKELNAKLKDRLALLDDGGKNLNAFEISRQKLALARAELAEMPFRTILYAWGFGALRNIAEPAIALDPRVRALNQASFYNAHGRGLIERSVDFITGNNAHYVVWLGLGLVGSAVSLALQVFGVFLSVRRMPWLALFGLLWVVYFLLLNGPVGGPKYRLPFEPVLIIFLSIAVIDLASRFRRRCAR